MRKHFNLTALLLIAVFICNAVAATAKTKQESTIKILAIGNSFSQDAVEQYLWDLADADNTNVIIGNLYYGGCSLEQHWNFLINNMSNYSYRKIVDGAKVDTPKFSLSEALADEDWDYVSFQQASHFSGMPLTYAPYLDYLVDYVRKHVGKSTKFIFHSTWAYASSSTHKGFANYNCSQQVMFDEIIATTQLIMDAYNFDILIPAGTAIQNARTSSLADTMNRDGYHLNLTYGRYTAACTWYEAIFKKCVVGNKFAPDGMTDTQKVIAQESAHEAILHPFEVTRISE